MSISGFIKTPKRLYRLSQILQVLVKHGFGHLVYNLRLHTYLPLLNRLQDKKVKGVRVSYGSLAKRVTTVCQELGPTFVKLGQVLSTRPDIIPENFVEELKSLQNNVKPFDPSVARSIIEKELKAPVSKLFLQLDEEPFASGSIAQVHKATLLDGSDVVVKVKRPGIGSVILNDLEILSYIAEQAEKIDEFKVYRPALIVSEFARKIERELDFVSEASSTASFSKNFAKTDNVKIPNVFWDYSTHNILTIERFAYTTLTDIKAIDIMGINRSKLAFDLATSFMSQYFEKRLFHADPHPGNLMVSKEGDIAMIDFGMVGYVTDELRKQLAGSVLALMKKDLDLFVEIFIEMGVVSTSCDMEGLRISLFEIIDKYYGIPLKNVDIQKAFSDAMRVAREHDMILPRDLIMMLKSFVTVTSMARTMDREFNFIDVVTPFMDGRLKERISIENLSKSAASSSWHVSNLIRQAPKELRYILRKIIGGNMQIVMKHKGLDGLITDLDKSSNRLSLSVILASTIMGSSMIMMGKIGPLVLGNISVLGIVGYVLALVMGFSLVFAIFRSGKL